MRKSLLFIVIAAFCGSSVPIFAKFALEIFQPFTLVFIRFLIASLSLLFLVKDELNLKSFKNLIIPSLFGALNPILLFIALQFTTATITPLIYAGVPALTALYLAKVKKQTISTNQILGVATGLLGVLTIIILPLFSQTDISAFEIIKGNILIFGASLGFLAYGLTSKQKQLKTKTSPIALTFYFSLITLLLSLPFAIFEIVNSPISIENIRTIHIASSLGVGLIGTSLFYFSYQYALKIGDEISAAVFTYLQPVITAVFAATLLGEKITIPIIVGGALAIVGAQAASGQLRFLKGLKK
jgi:drug/metabolite transporter (DMT)-like permease